MSLSKEKSYCPEIELDGSVWANEVCVCVCVCLVLLEYDMCVPNNPYSVQKPLGLC